MLLLDVTLLFAWRPHRREPFLELRPEVADRRPLEPTPAIAGGAS